MAIWKHLWPTIAVAILLWFVVSSNEGTLCEQQQYLELGRTGTIDCSFRGDFAAVFWYNSHDRSDDALIAFLSDSEKGGKGLESGEYDISEKGLLIIQNVTLGHEGQYNVLRIVSTDVPGVSHLVNVSAKVTPTTLYPVIPGCHDDHTICIREDLNTSNQLQCSVHDARPQIGLTWVSSTSGGESKVTSDVVANCSDRSCTTLASHNLPYLQGTDITPLLSLLICRADEPTKLLNRDESMVLIDHSKFDPRVRSGSVSHFIWMGTSLNLSCPSDSDVRLWKKSPSGNLAVQIAFRDIDEVFSSEVELGEDGTLTIKKAGIHSEGRYTCLGTSDVKSYVVQVAVPPTPRKLLVEGCIHDGDCLLSVPTESHLTCTVKAIRPEIQLRWESSFENFFIRSNTSVEQHDGIYDISHIGYFRATSDHPSRLSVTCGVSGPNAHLFKYEQHVTLFISGLPDTTSSTNSLWIIAVFVIVMVIIAVLIIFYMNMKDQRCRPDRTQPNGRASDPEEEIPMYTRSGIGETTTDIQELTSMLIEQLKSTYMDFHQSVRPIPFIADQVYSVSNIFVEGGIEVLDGTNRWIRLKSFTELFTNSLTKSTRQVLEGDPGYGKSTIALQILYDWCQPTPPVYLECGTLLIALRLRNLHGVNSIYRAIRQSNLPRDSNLTENNLRNIIHNSDSVVFILDGYDEYPDKDMNNDISKMIERKIFQNATVIITTRTSRLPKTLSPQTKRVRLTGFDEDTQNRYLRKAINASKEEIVSIKRVLGKNRMLDDLCQVPLFFVMYAHVSHDKPEFQQISSTTAFFRYMITCLHAHIQNKFPDSNEYKAIEHDHDTLNKVAYEVLGKNQPKAGWSSEYFENQLGQGYYDIYLKMGILVEETLLIISDDPRSREHVTHKTAVRFYHKLICEWYAAHYIITLQGAKLRDILENHNPLDFEYLYRFSCGLSEATAKRVVEYLRQNQEMAKFAILCMVEQGKSEDYLETVTSIASSRVTVSKTDSKLLQWSTLKLMEFASQNEISIENLYFIDVLFGANFANGLEVEPTIRVPILPTLQWFGVREYAKEMTNDVLGNILLYASKCPVLTGLVFTDCTMPQIIEDEKLMSTLKSKGVRVRWGRYHQLNLLTGHWRMDGKGQDLTDDQYQDRIHYIKNALVWPDD